MNHKEWVKNTFDRAAPQYGEELNPCFNYFGGRLVDLARLSKTDRILDVATGKGAVLLPASQIAQNLVGIDLSPEMIQAAKKRVPQAEIIQMDAEHLTFPDHSFDVVFCAFAIFFFPALAQALSEFRRVLKYSGRLVVSIWGEKNPLDQWTSERARKLGAASQLKVTALDTRETLHDCLASAGFNKITISQESKTFWYKRAEDWWDSLWARGVRSQFEQLSAENLALLRQEALRQAPLLAESNAGQLGIKREVFYAIAQY